MVTVADAPEVRVPAAQEMPPASERRKASRPWNGKNPAAEQPPVAAKRAANDADDSVWKEF